MRRRILGAKNMIRCDYLLASVSPPGCSKKRGGENSRRMLKVEKGYKRERERVGGAGGERERGRERERRREGERDRQTKTETDRQGQRDRDRANWLSK